MDLGGAAFWLFVAAAVVAGIWLVERAFNMKIITP